jgi:hypothetical protein
MELPSVDDRVYKTILLPNDLQVLLISDPTTDKAAAALDVRVGQLCDGSVEGLAHFCEHMLYVQLSVQNDDVYCTSYENMVCMMCIAQLRKYGLHIGEKLTLVAIPFHRFIGTEK